MKHPHSVRVSRRQGASPYRAGLRPCLEFHSGGIRHARPRRGRADASHRLGSGRAAGGRRMADALDATLVESCVSRLVIDCNRPLDAPDLISPVSETTVMPGNADLSEADRQERIALSWQPFHDAHRRCGCRERWPRGARRGSSPSIPSRRSTRAWTDPGTSASSMTRTTGWPAPMIGALRGVVGLEVGVNEPYSPADRVYFTLERHGRARGPALRHDRDPQRRDRRRDAASANGPSCCRPSWPASIRSQPNFANTTRSA